MRSRSTLEPAGAALGAAAEGIWAGALAAALTGASAAVLTVFAGVTVLAAAQVARRFGAGQGRERAARLLAMTLILVAAATLLVAGRAWAHPSPLWLVVRDVVYAGGLVALGLHLGSDPPSPEAAVRRAVRGFALLGAVLLVAALVHSTPGWAPWAVVAALVVGGLLVAIVRYQTLTDLVDPIERLPAWPWLLAVVGAVLVVIALGALLSQVLRVDVLLWALAVVAGVLRYALLAAAYLIGYAGAGLVRALAWLLGALHLSGWHPVLRPRTRAHAGGAASAQRPRRQGLEWLQTDVHGLGALGRPGAFVRAGRGGAAPFSPSAAGRGHGHRRARGARLADVGGRGVRGAAGAAAAPPPADAPLPSRGRPPSSSDVATRSWNSDWRAPAGRGRPA